MSRRRVYQTKRSNNSKYCHLNTRRRKKQKSQLRTCTQFDFVSKTWIPVHKIKPHETKFGLKRDILEKQCFDYYSLDSNTHKDIYPQSH